MRYILIGILATLLQGCAYNPIVDHRGLDGKNVAFRYNDDLETCRAIADDNTNDFINGSKVVYNKMRWRILWLSPELKTKKNIVNNCMKGRGYSILN